MCVFVFTQHIGVVSAPSEIMNSDLHKYFDFTVVLPSSAPHTTCCQVESGKRHWAGRRLDVSRTRGVESVVAIGWRYSRRETSRSRESGSSRNPRSRGTLTRRGRCFLAGWERREGRVNRALLEN